MRVVGKRGTAVCHDGRRHDEARFPMLNPRDAFGLLPLGVEISSPFTSETNNRQCYRFSLLRVFYAQIQI